MNTKILNFSDNLKNINDELHLNNNGDVKLRGELIVSNDLGEEIFRKNNTIVVGGRRLVLEKIFNLDPTLISRITLNNLFSNNMEETPIVGDGPRREQCILLFGVGTGGSDLSFGSVYAPDSVNYNLYNMVPLRHVDITNDLSREEMKSYYMKVKNGNKYSYYLKKFNTVPKLVMKQGDIDFVPKLTDNSIFNSDHTAIVREAVDVYCEVQFKISEKDVREYFIAQESIRQARINEIGLFYGYYDEHSPNQWVDIKSCQMFSKITFDIEALNNYSKIIYCTYRIYA